MEHVSYVYGMAEYLTCTRVLTSDVRNAQRAPHQEKIHNLRQTVSNDSCNRKHAYVTATCTLVMILNSQSFMCAHFHHHLQNDWHDGM